MLGWPVPLKTSSEVGRVEDGGCVRVCEARPAGNLSSHFILRRTLLSMSGAKLLKFITMFKLLQGFFTDTSHPHHEAPTKKSTLKD